MPCPIGPLLLAALLRLAQDEPGGPPPLRALDARRAAIEALLSSGEVAAAAEEARALGVDVAELAGAPPLYRAEIAALEQRSRDLRALGPGGLMRLEQARSARQAEPREALATLGELLGSEHEELAWTRRSACLQRIGDGSYAEAEELAREAVRLVSALPEDRAVSIARHRMWLGEALHQQFRDEEALEHLAACRDVWERLRSVELGLYEEEALHTTDALARALDRLHRYAEAEELHRAFLIGTRGVFGERSRQYATAANNLAVHLRERGEIARAIPLFYENLARKLELLDAGHASVGVAWMNLGSVLTAAGEPEEAADAFAAALAIFERHGAGASLPAAMTRVLLSELYLLERDVGSAQAIALPPEAARAALAEQPPHLARALLAHAVILVEQRDLAGAERTLEEVRDLVRAHRGADHAKTAEALAALAMLYEQRGELERAAELYAGGLREQGTQGFDADSQSEMHAGLGRVRFALGELEAAEAELEKAVELAEHRRAQRPLGLEIGQASPHAHLASLRLRRGDAQGAWEAVEQAQGRTLFQLVSAAAQPPAAAAAGRGELQAEALRVEQRLKALDAGEAKASSEHADLRTELSARLASLRAELARAGALEALEPYPLGRVRAQLAPDEALVGWLMVRDPDQSIALLAWCLRREGDVRWFRTPLSGPDELWQRLDAFRGEVGAVARAPFPSQPGALALVEDALRKLLFGALEAGGALAGVAHLVVVPTRHVDALPLDALAGDRWTASFAPSASLYAWLRERERAPPDEPAVLALGDPPFGAPGGDPGGTGADAAARLRSPVRSALEGLAALPRTRDEVRAVAGAFPKSRELVGTDASEAMLDQLAAEGRLASFHTLHFATHALVDDERPSRSAIALSQRDLPDPLAAAIRGDPPIDGLLTAAEVLARWRLDADLVTLSGCRTALGKHTASEGYLGLGTAFLQAGARSLLVSLWDVDDEATMLFMQSFYRHWRGGEDLGPRAKAEALRRARRDLRAHSPDGSQHPFAHPAYWAAFVLIGDPY